MAPTGANFLLQLIMIVGFGLYFAWGLRQMAQRESPGNKVLQRQNMRKNLELLVIIILLAGLLYAWQYKVWQPLGIMGAITAVLLLSFHLFLPPRR